MSGGASEASYDKQRYREWQEPRWNILNDSCISVKRELCAETLLLSDGPPNQSVPCEQAFHVLQRKSGNAEILCIFKRPKNLLLHSKKCIYQ